MEAAFRRKGYMQQLSDEELRAFPALGIAIAGQDASNLPEANRRRAKNVRRMREIVCQMDKEIGIKP